MVLGNGNLSYLTTAIKLAEFDEVSQKQRRNALTKTLSIYCES